MKPRNKKQITATLSLVLVFGLTLFTAVQAQDAYKINKASVVINGTSTMHDWEMKSETFTCNTQFKLDGNKVVDVKGLQLTVAATSLKSGKGAMDKNAYSALKANDHKNISYVLTSSKVVGNKILSAGNLTIAGVTKPFEVESTYVINADNTISTKTAKSFKMSEFNVEPPSFMFGSVTTGDAITLTFDLTFKKI